MPRLGCLGQYPRRHGPADDAAGIEVKDGGDLEPAPLGGDVGHVGQPHLVGLRGDKVLLQLIGRIAVLGVAVRGALEAAGVLGCHPSLAHQPHDPVTSAADALLPQSLQNLGAAVASSTQVMDLLNLTQQLQILLSAWTLRRLAPPIVDD